MPDPTQRATRRLELACDHLEIALDIIETHDLAIGDLPFDLVAYTSSLRAITDQGLIGPPEPPTGCLHACGCPPETTGPDGHCTRHPQLTIGPAQPHGVLDDPALVCDVWAMNELNLPRSNRWGVLDHDHTIGLTRV